MKKFLAILTVLSLCACALAEIPVYNGSQLVEDAEICVDLNNDGTDETLTWTIVRDEYDEYPSFIVNGMAFTGDCLLSPEAYLCDLDGDGVKELFLTGDLASDDYITYCLHYENGVLMTVPFAASSRGNTSEEGYDECGYGGLERIDEETIALCGSQDVLGTRFGSRVMALQDGAFEFVDDGFWRFEYDLNDPDVWEYAAMTTLCDLNATYYDYDNEGFEEDCVLPAGTRLLITATDKLEVAYLTIDGQSGHMNVTPNAENGWGWIVSGVPEEEAFDFVPYAD